ncbi:MAG: two-component sensor histidine kinase [Actinomycetia bacterium]|nr:two-component sensor histidine kinase [Actinomycetes bacterium]
MRRRLLVAVVVTLVGVSMVGFIGWQYDSPMKDTVSLLVNVVVVAVLVGMVGALVLRSLEAVSLEAHSVLVALVTTAGVVAGALRAESRMFLATPDVGSLMMVAVAAGTVGVVMAVSVGSRIDQASRYVTELTRRIGEGAPAQVDARPPTREFAALASELETMAGRLDESRQRERQLEQARRQLVAWVSHDLRTPLAGIRAMVEAIQDGVVDDRPTIDRYHTQMGAAVETLSSLVDDLFELSRIEAGALDLHRQEIDLADLVSETVSVFGPLADREGVVIEGHSDRPLVASVSAREIGRAIHNLVDNAIRHTPEGGSVAIDAACESGVAVISVVDTGGGVPPEHLDRIFEHGYRADGARSPGRDTGAGLGLAIARGFIEAHGGALTVENVPTDAPVGARFCLRLPI